MPHLDDFLIEEAKKDAMAFGELVLRYQDQLYNFLYRMTGNPQDAQDLAQEAFLRIFKALPRFRPGSPFRPWMYKIAFNLAMTSLKSRRRTAYLDEELPSSAPFASPESVAEIREVQRELRKAILELPDAYRAIILLRHVDQLSYEEIAQALDVPLGTAKVRLHRARLLLQEKLLAAGVIGGDHAMHRHTKAASGLPR